MTIKEGYYLLSKYRDVGDKNRVFCRVIDLQTSMVRTLTEEEFNSCPQKYNEKLHGECLMPEDYVVSRNFAMYLDRNLGKLHFWFLGYAYEIPYDYAQEFDYHAIYWHLIADGEQLMIKTFFDRDFLIDVKRHLLVPQKRSSCRRKYPGRKQSFTSFLSGILLN